MKRALGLIWALLASPLAAQDIVVESLDDQPFIETELEPLVETTEGNLRVVQGSGAVLRGLDKLNGEVVDIELQSGFGVRFGDIRVDLAECRYPEGNPAGEAFAFLTISELDAPEIKHFQGWMIASSPALSAMDHARFDIWVMRCSTS